MLTIKVSNSYRVTIPKSVRAPVGLQPGQLIDIEAVGGSIVITPESTLKWPDDYINSEGDIWKDIDVKRYIEDERNSWE